MKLHHSLFANLAAQPHRDRPVAAAGNQDRRWAAGRAPGHGVRAVILAGALLFTAATALPVAAQEGEVTVNGGSADPTATATPNSDTTLLTIPGGGAEIDADGDGLSDQQENYWGLNPFRFDTDGDGLGDGDEFYDRYARSDPSLYDTDWDGLSDGAEVFGHHGYRTDPFYYDTDWDGKGDGEEIFRYGSNPLQPDR